MKFRFKTVLAAGLAAVIMPHFLSAAEDASLTDPKKKASYGIGMYFGTQIKRANLEVDMDILLGAINDVLAGRETKLTQPQAQEAIMAYQQARAKELAEKNHKAGEAFLAANKTKPGVKTHEVTLPDGSKAELQYKVIKEGTGGIPRPGDRITANYRGTLIDGKEFDSTAKQGQASTTLSVNGVIRGWSEALQMMKTGSKWELYIPAKLAYGDTGSGSIEPGSTLIFELELLSILPAPVPPPPGQPLVSETIEVPSADQMKTGRTVRVVPPEELRRMQGQTNAAPASGR